MCTPHKKLRRVVGILTVKTMNMTLVHLVPVEWVASIKGVIEGITLLCDLRPVVEPV
jgi:hypothetical protein